MSEYYIASEAEIAAVADAIREKGETTEQIQWPDGFVSAIDAIDTRGDPVALSSPTISVSSSGLITATVSQGDGWVFADTKSTNKQLSVQGAQTITPGTSNKTIASGVYLTGTQTIAGDSDLKASNIKQGVNIFNVVGTYTGLNFTIVGGTTQPSSPAENTLWVNTSATITDWVFSAATPTIYSNGTLWIETSTNSSMHFDAIDNNVITVYPFIAYHRISSAWTKVNISLYKGGTWYTGDLILYDGTAWNSDYTYATTSCTVTNYSSSGYLKLSRSDGGNAYFDVIVDLTGYDTLQIDYEVPTQHYGSVDFYVQKDGSTKASYAFASGTIVPVRKTANISITSLSGEHTIRLKLWGSDSCVGYLHALKLLKS